MSFDLGTRTRLVPDGSGAPQPLPREGSHGAPAGRRYCSSSQAGAGAGLKMRPWNGHSNRVGEEATSPVPLPGGRRAARTTISSPSPRSRRRGSARSRSTWRSGSRAEFSIATRLWTERIPRCRSLRGGNRHRASPHRETRSEATTTRRPRMRAHTITTMSRRRRSARRRRVLALALGVCALAIPATANAQPNDSGYSSANAITGGSSESSQPGGGSDYSSVNSIAPPASEPSGSGGSQSTDSGYSSLNAISGAPAERADARHRLAARAPATDSTGAAPWSAPGPRWLSPRSALPRCSRSAGALRCRRRPRRAEASPPGVQVTGAEP